MILYNEILLSVIYILCMYTYLRSSKFKLKKLYWIDKWIIVLFTLILICMKKRLFIGIFNEPQIVINSEYK